MKKYLKVVIPKLKDKTIEEQLDKLLNMYKNMFIIKEVNTIQTNPNGSVEYHIKYLNKGESG